MLVATNSACQESGEQAPVHDPVLAQQLNRASSVALVEITKLTKQDDRPMDGDHWLKVEFRSIKSSGDLPEYLYLVIARGGLAPVPVREALPSILTPDSFEIGDQHWFIFGADYDSEKYPYGVVKWWPGDDDESIPKQVLDALEEDRFDWHPIFDPRTGVVFGHTFDSTEDFWKVRVEKEGMRLWEARMSGRPMTETNFLFAYPGLLPEMQPIEGEVATTSVLNVESIRSIPENNPYEAEAGEYRIREAFDLGNGQRIGAWVMRPQVSSVINSYHQFDAISGARVFERRNYSVTQFSEEVGADKTTWYFRVEKRIDPESGEVIGYSFFRYGQRVDEDGNNLGNGFVPIPNETIEEIGLDRILASQRKSR